MFHFYSIIIKYLTYFYINGFRESESHSSLLLDDMSPDENGPPSGVSIMI